METVRGLPVEYMVRLRRRGCSARWWMPVSLWPESIHTRPSAFWWWRAACVPSHVRNARTLAVVLEFWTRRRCGHGQDGGECSVVELLE